MKHRLGCAPKPTSQLFPLTNITVPRRRSGSATDGRPQRGRNTLPRTLSPLPVPLPRVPRNWMSKAAAVAAQSINQHKKSSPRSPPPQTASQSVTAGRRFLRDLSLTHTPPTTSHRRLSVSFYSSYNSSVASALSSSPSSSTPRRVATCSADSACATKTTTPVNEVVQVRREGWFQQREKETHADDARQGESGVKVHGIKNCYSSCCRRYMAGKACGLPYVKPKPVS